MEEKKDLKDVWTESISASSPPKASVREEDLSIDDQWDEASLAALVGYEAGTKSPSNSSLLPDADNVIEQSELFDDPVANKSKPSFASNPYAKALGAGIPLLAIFGFAGLFVSGVTGEKNNKTPPAVAKPLTPQPSVAIAKVEPQETGNLKTQVALGKQAEQIKAIDEAKKPKLEVKPQKPALQTSPSQSASVPSSSAPSPPSSFPPDYRPTRSQVSPPPLAQRQLPDTTVGERQSPKQPTREVKPIDASEQWMALSKLGSYGKVESGAAQLSSSSDRGSATSDPVKQTATEQTAASNIYTVPHAVPVLTASSQFVAPMPQTEKTAPGGIVSPLASTIAHASIDSAEEAHLLNGIPIRTLQVGTVAKGQLVTPLVWSEPSAISGVGTNATQLETTATPQEFVVGLTQPLSDASGRPTLPAATQLICQVASIDRSGLVNLDAKRAVIEGQEYVLPTGAIGIRGRDGQPFMASKYGKGSSLLSADLQGVLFGAIGRVGQVLTQPDSQASTDVSGTGFSSSTTSSHGGKNILGAVLDGAFNPLSQQIQQRTQENRAAIRSLPELWYVGAGKDVQVFVNQSFEF